ncbi:MAG: hypothetical protein KDC46_12375, partial [Thermoleophilia bacterium]|nr:hypothetical protein [Thermoleophilia bacterium]
MQQPRPQHVPRWDHGPLDETLHDARALSVSVADVAVRHGWEQLARIAGIPRRRWRRHHPIASGARLVQVVDGQPALDAAAWERFVSLVPGAVALPTRTATSFGIARSSIRPPDRRVGLFDLLAARRRRRRLRRVVRDLAAEQARLRRAIDEAAAAAIAQGDDGAPMGELPAYALAARLDALLAAASEWSLLPLVDLLAVEATMQLVGALRERGREPGQALLEAAQLQAGGGIEVPPHLESLAAAQLADGPERVRLLEQWRTGIDGWHAMRELVLEEPPLAMLGDDDLLRLASTTPSRHVSVEPRDELREELERDEQLAAIVAHARSMTARRESVARDRATWYAAIRALVATLAARLVRDGLLDRAELVYDLTIDELRRVARGAAVDARPDGARRSSGNDLEVRDFDTGNVVSIGPVQLRGIPASAGTASGRVLVVVDPLAELDVDGAVLVCRSTDPAWMPLMMQCAALVTERGGPLSHAAIVARELGLPAVVGVAGVLEAA